MTINRDLYLNQLIAAKHDGFIKIITGIRRCGKSYLLFKLFKQHLLAAGVSPEHIIEVDLEKKSSQNLRPPTLFSHTFKSASFTTERPTMFSLTRFSIASGH